MDEQPVEPPLRRIHVAGFRSLRDVSLDVRAVNILIGPNGAGKSNLLAALRLVSIVRAQLRLPQFGGHPRKRVQAPGVSHVQEEESKTAPVVHPRVQG